MLLLTIYKDKHESNQAKFITLFNLIYFHSGEIESQVSCSGVYGRKIGAEDTL